MTNVSLQVALDADTFTVCWPKTETSRAKFSVEDALETNAKRIVYSCESFQEFVERSGLERGDALMIWESAWDSYDSDEARATGN